MTWFWNSSSNPEETNSQSKSSPPPSASQNRPFKSDSQTSSSSIDDFISTLEAGNPSPSSPNTKPLDQKPSTSLPTTSTTSTTTTTNPLKPDPNSLSELLLPTTMSARQAFDAAFYCQSLGGKFMDVYRYGEWQPCSEHWGDFWFALKVRTTGEPVKSDMIRARYRGKLAKYRLGPSSEDIWKSREKMVKEGEAFAYEFPEDEGLDVEWNAREEEMRRKIREKEFGEKFL